MEKQNSQPNTEIGEIQLDWKIVKLGEIAEKMKAGGTPFTSNAEYWGTEIPLVKVEDAVSCPKYLSKTKLSITKKGVENSSTWIVPSNSIILTMYGTPGEVCINLVPVAVTQNVMGIIPSEKVDLDFLYYALKYAKIYTLHRIADRTIFTHFSLSKAKNLEFPLPPLPEQRAIAHVLRTVQQDKEATDKVIAAMKELKKSMMKHLFTYGPVPFDEVGKVKLKETEIGEIPEDWATKPLLDIATLQRGKDLTKQNQISGPYPVVGSSGVIGYHNEYICHGPGIVVGRSGSVGNITYIEQDFWPHNTALYVKDFHENNPKFVYYLLPSLKIRQYATGVSVPTLNRNFIHAAVLPIPPQKVQANIVSALEIIDAKIRAEQSKSQALDNLFKSLLKNLMTGKVRVKDAEVPT